MQVDWEWTIVHKVPFSFLDSYYSRMSSVPSVPLSFPLLSLLAVTPPLLFPSLRSPSLPSPPFLFPSLPSSPVSSSLLSPPLLRSIWEDVRMSQE